MLFLNGSEFKSPREVLTLNYECSMDRPLLILPCTQRPRRHFSTSWPLVTGSRLRLHQVVWTSLYKLRRNLPLQMAFFGQSNSQQVVRDGKHMLPRQCVPRPPTQWHPHGGQHWAESLEGLTAGGQVGGLNALAAKLIREWLPGGG